MFSFDQHSSDHLKRISPFEVSSNIGCENDVSEYQVKRARKEMPFIEEDAKTIVDARQDRISYVSVVNVCVNELIILNIASLLSKKRKNS
jgi:hypothetical protein